MFLSHSRQHQEPQHKDRLVAYTLSELIRTGYLVDGPWGVNDLGPDITLKGAFEGKVGREKV